MNYQKNKLTVMIYCRRGYKLFNHNSKIPFGGAEVELYNLAVSLAKEGCQVFFLCEKDKDFDEIETISSVEVVRIRELRKEIIFKPYYFFMLLFETINLIKKIKPHVILQATAAFETGLLCFLKSRAKFIYRIENDWDVNKDFSKYKPLVSRVYEYGLRNADAVIAQTVYQQELLKENYGRNSFLVKNAQAMPKNDEILPLSERKYFLWVGRLTELKRTELFIDLARHNPEHKFLLIGSYETPNKYVELVISSAGQLSNLTMHLGLNWMDVIPYYKKAIALVITSDPRGEGYPNVMLEAMKYGCPIYSLAWNRDDIINREKIGRVFYNDTKSFLEGIKSFVMSEDQWNEYSRNAYEYARKNHDIEAIVKQYLDIFRLVLCQNPK